VGTSPRARSKGRKGARERNGIEDAGSKGEELGSAVEREKGRERRRDVLCRRARVLMASEALDNRVWRPSSRESRNSTASETMTREGSRSVARGDERDDVLDDERHVCWQKPLARSRREEWERRNGVPHGEEAPQPVDGATISSGGGQDDRLARADLIRLRAADENGR
jgi:hypothetical protein